jgi:hypothetical protein
MATGLPIPADIKQPGNFAFKAGNVRIKAVNGQTGSVMAVHFKLMRTSAG